MKNLARVAEEESCFIRAGKTYTRTILLSERTRAAKKEIHYRTDKKKLKKIRATKKGKERRQPIQELKALRKKLAPLTNEACHKIAKKVVAIARRYPEEAKML